MVKIQQEQLNGLFREFRLKKNGLKALQNVACYYNFTKDKLLFSSTIPPDNSVFCIKGESIVSGDADGNSLVRLYVSPNVDLSIVKECFIEWGIEIVRSFKHFEGYTVYHLTGKDICA